MNAALADLYRDILMDHYKYPRGKKMIEHPDIENEGKNPLCGDSMTVQVRLNNDMIEDVGVNCAGCAICTASASMLADIITGKSVKEAREIAHAVKHLLKGEEFETNLELGDLEALEGVKKFPVRIKCALLSWTTLANSLEAWENGKKQETATSE